MAEILINELSLTGQFNSVDDFICGGFLAQFVSILNEMKGTNVLLYKKNNFYESMITKNITIYNILVETISRQYDEIRKLKSDLSCLFEDPYWENNQKHSLDIYYSYNDACVTGQSLAEACERDRVVASFTHNDFPSGQLSIQKEKEEVVVNNVAKGEDYLEIAWTQNFITCEEYCIRKFRGSKLDFSQIRPKEGFAILNEENEDLFIDGFRKFTALTWQEIHEDKGFTYKEYEDRKKHFKSLNKKIFEFRISIKYRCFGYKDQEIFHIICFDLTHYYGDSG
jgi:hypothetical protein